MINNNIDLIQSLMIVSNELNTIKTELNSKNFQTLNQYLNVDIDLEFKKIVDLKISQLITEFELKVKKEYLKKAITNNSYHSLSKILEEVIIK